MFFDIYQIISKLFCFTFQIGNDAISVTSFVIILSKINIFSAIFEHIVKYTGNLMGSCRNGLGRTQVRFFPP
jgi:hypothetical protein